MDVEKLTEELTALEGTLGQSTGMVSAFGAELEKMRGSLALAGQETSSLTSGFSSGVKRAVDGLVLDGARLSDVLKGLAKSMIDTAYSAAMKPVSQGIGSLLSAGVGKVVGALSPFADGAPFAQGRVMPFAQGGVVSSPVSFPMRGGTGLMGEAGPEAIMPLSRGADGRLGVRMAGGGRPVTVVMNIQTPDVAGFERSQSQIAARAARALARGQRNR